MWCVVSPGPYGAYDGWLGEAVTALSRLGHYAAAVNLTRAMAPVYARGPGALRRGVPHTSTQHTLTHPHQPFA